jgi:Cu/Ag efflux protein CusF
MTVPNVRAIACVVLATFLLLGCSKESSKDPASYAIRGEVVAMDPASSRISIAHQEIPGLMKAMTMAFRAKNPALLKTVSIGDSISGTLTVSNGEIFIDTLIVSWKNKPATTE